MANEEFNNEDFIISLTIDGTEYKDVEVQVSNPNKTIHEQIESIVRVFELPENHPNGLPRQYVLGKMLKDEEEPIILDFEDEDGNEQSLMDYNIKKGDRLHLIEPPLYGPLMVSEEGYNSSVELVTDRMAKKREKPFWRHILYGCWF